MTDGVPDFCNTRLADIVAWAQGRLGQGPLAFEVLDPDVCPGAYPGERVVAQGREAIHRPLRLWVDFAERLRLRLRTPRPVAGPPAKLELRYEPLDESSRPWSKHDERKERYGAQSHFQKICRLDDPYFVLDLADALQRIELRRGVRILDLGVNAGDEVELLSRFGVPDDSTWVGIDHSASALERARQRFPGPRFEFIQADINRIDAIAPALGTFDLIVSIGTLQSPGLDDREVFRLLIQKHLRPGGSVIVGFPNCEYVDGEPLYGARTVNITQPELSLLVKTVAFYKKYLQQHRMRVFVTGKDDVFITGVGAQP